MIESKSVQVHPASENSTIDLWQNFGWTLQNSQEVNTAESHLERRGDDLYSVTNTQNYVKLVFQRDTSMPNYARIKELEGKYAEILNSEPSRPRFDFGDFTSLWFLLLIPPLVYLVGYFRDLKWYKESYPGWARKMETEGKGYYDEATSLLS